ncbi:MAG TPA: ATP-binding protein [Polyangia bacterium]|nr:ATP-binding protein [Polyangia bacterium]
MAEKQRSSRAAVLSARLALASGFTAAAIGVVCFVAVKSLGNASAVARVAVARQLALIDDASAMRAFSVQRGMVSQYILTGDRKWLAEPEAPRPSFSAWLERADAAAETPESRRVLTEIRGEYLAYDAAGNDAVALYDAGHVEEAKNRLTERAQHGQRVRTLFESLGQTARREAEQKLVEEQGTMHRLAWLLVLTSVGGAVASLVLGFMWSRRVTKPIYELQVRVESAAERTRIQVAPGRAGLQALGDQVSALVERLEEADASLAEHRRQLLQSEKLSAVGELAAKLAHEVLNPLAGMKAAVQLLARQGVSQSVGGGDVLQTAEALNREITRVEGLVRRLVNYSRPLAPRFELTSVGALLDAAEEASQSILTRAGTSIVRHVDPGLPPVEVDPLLVTQALVNLVANAAEATVAAGRSDRIEVEATTATLHGRDNIVIRVADNGDGVSDEHARELFKPFFTTKPEGHGLGLAVSQNVLLEHGGRILARNRPAEDGPGAIFEVQFPVVR